MYDCIGHLKKFGFEWSVNDKNLDFRYEIKIDNSDAKKLIKNIIYQDKQEIFYKLMNQGYRICCQLGDLIILLKIEYRI